MVTHKMSVKLFKSEVLNASLMSVVSDDGETYFKAKDVAVALGYTNPRDAILKHGVTSRGSRIATPSEKEPHYRGFNPTLCS